VPVRRNYIGPQQISSRYRKPPIRTASWLDSPASGGDSLKGATLTESALTATDVAELLNLNVETVYALIRSGGLPAAKVGGHWRFFRSKALAGFEARHVSGLEAPQRETDMIGESQ
jgi:excisionase family DNA binding protein